MTTSQSTPATARPRILLIDDTPLILAVISRGLSGQFTVDIAHSGPEGLELAANNPPDLILLDLLMPGMDGYEVCRRLKADPLLRDIPVVFLTASGDSSSEINGLGLGAADYLHKPVNLPIARQRLSNLVEQYRLNREIASHRERLEELVRERTEQLSVANEQLRQTNQALTAARHASEAANRTKVSFLQTVGHELYTPLNAILGHNEILLGQLGDPALRKRSERINDAGRDLHHLIQRILQLASLEGHFGDPLDPTDRFNLRDTLNATIRQARPKATQKGLHLELDVAANVPQSALGQAGPLRKILDNLIDNAIKFSERGTIRLLASIETAADNEAVTRITVIDEGCGIASSDLEKIFADFSRLDDGLTRRHGGMGIGLAICRHLARLMKGQMGVESTINAGSRFWLDIPLQHFSYAGAQSAAEASAVSAAHPPEAGHETSPPTTSAATPPAINTSEAQEHLNRLIALLEVDDYAALKSWENSRPLIAPLLGAALPAFARALEEFAFETALAQLRQIREIP